MCTIVKSNKSVSLYLYMGLAQTTTFGCCIPQYQNTYNSIQHCQVPETTNTLYVIIGFSVVKRCKLPTTVSVDRATADNPSGVRGGGVMICNSVIFNSTVD